ncbi:hypothetical protein AVEN_62333-1 [Araneus ventricosus]|uniref:Uncharacterized protein n=1 Tax=Araneus ventricosus TaxID=182803 RepID=A0A4Y2TGA1_ARAVE|nr:hypothetical protein AVEN_62333-1 [Araneus ventricosus]
MGATHFVTFWGCPWVEWAMYVWSFFSWQCHPRREGHFIILLPSGVQGLVPTEAALSSFTMSRSPIVLTICSHVWSWRRGTSLKVLHWFVIFCGRADSWTWSS